jgi:hypothetical protein
MVVIYFAWEVSLLPLSIHFSLLSLLSSRSSIPSPSSTLSSNEQNFPSFQLIIFPDQAIAPTWNRADDQSITEADFLDPDGQSPYGQSQYGNTYSQTQYGNTNGYQYGHDNDGYA